MKVRLTQIDGKLPNLALMKLAHWHRSKGDSVFLTRRIYPELSEPAYGVVYGSAIFKYSAGRLARFQEQWPQAIIGGTGTGRPSVTVELVTGGPWEFYDYSDYPGFVPSMGFTQRGCRLKCKFCVVPAKEGKPESVNSISDIWRGPGHAKKLILLDNDFFGQPEKDWRARLEEIRSGGFKVSLNQGINVRLITEEAARELASIDYRDDQFKSRRLYTAWDNLKDEKVFLRGIDRLTAAGIRPGHIMSYMLIGFAKDETIERILYRFEKMVSLGILPYPMVFDRTNRELVAFQRWAITGLYRAVAWPDYLHSASKERLEKLAIPDLFSHNENGK